MADEVLRKNVEEKVLEFGFTLQTTSQTQEGVKRFSEYRTASILNYVVVNCSYLHTVSLNIFQEVVVLLNEMSFIS